MTSARNSWNLPPRDLVEAAYIPSQWRVHRISALLLMMAVLGTIPLCRLLNSGDDLHWQMAHSSRKRTPAVIYPVKVLC